MIQNCTCIDIYVNIYFITITITYKLMKIISKITVTECFKLLNKIIYTYIFIDCMSDK